MDLSGLEIPYYVLFIPYLVALFIFAWWFFFNIYHALKFGFFDFSGKVTTITISCVCICIIGLTILLLAQVPWFDTVDTSTLMPSSFETPFDSSDINFDF